MKNRISTILKENKLYIIIGLVVLLIVGYFIFKAESSSHGASYTVGKKDIEQSVALSGKVQTSDRADLGFASAGRVARVFVKNNQQVSSGQVLAQLEIGGLLADLKIKQANYKTSDLDTSSAVSNAYRTLLSSDLTLIPDESTYTVTPPTVSGVYNGAEGQYKIIIDRENATSTDYYVSTFGIEKTKKLIDENAPTPLGTKGLYISFTKPIENYRETTWFLDIPNKSGASYVKNYNAYIEAKNRFDSSVNGPTDSSSLVAQAEIEKINAEIRKNTIYAPFSGRVTNIEKEVGENASSGERMITILGEGKLEVVLQVSELDVSRIAVGSDIALTMDAFPGETFHGILKTINSRETEVDGVPVYEAFVELPADSRIKTGMSANGIIVLAYKPNVIAIPSYMIEKSGSINTVEVLLKDDKTEKREVTLGLMGSDSMVEIVSGLNEGEQVVSTVK